MKNKIKMSLIYDQIKDWESKTSSLFGILIILTGIFILVTMLVQFDPAKLQSKSRERSPTGTLEIQTK
jgi:hypothetical protein